MSKNIVIGRRVPAPASETTVRKVAVAALGGTSIEWYDFLLYGTAAALVFPTVFFQAKCQRSSDCSRRLARLPSDPSRVRLEPSSSDISETTVSDGFTDWQ